MCDDKLTQASAWLSSSPRVVVFTGAGVSKESGIPTFRDEGGFWREFPVDEFATWNGLLSKIVSEPQRLADFLLAVLEPIADAEPNAAHRAVADLDKHCQATVVTQNIDGLH